MPRQARLDIPGALHHVMVRGINKSNIFSDDHDRQGFLDRLGRAVTEGHCAVYAWALMDNHVHLLFRSGREGISAVMRKVLTWYAQYLNRRHDRSGHLFENRFRSVLCDEEAYLLALVRYIHLNPVRANVLSRVEQLDTYPWSGHHAIVRSTKYPWMDADHLLARFGTSRHKAIDEYRRFVAEGAALGRVEELTGGGLVRSSGGWSQVLSRRRRGEAQECDERILGSGDFVEAVLKESEERQTRQLRLRQSGRTLRHIIEEECASQQVSLQELMSGSRRKAVSEARMVIAHRGKEELGLSAAETARHLGVSTSGITRAIDRLERKKRLS